MQVLVTGSMTQPVKSAGLIFKPKNCIINLYCGWEDLSGREGLPKDGILFIGSLEASDPYKGPKDRIFGFCCFDFDNFFKSGESSEAKPYFFYSPQSYITIHLRGLYNLHRVRHPLSSDPRFGSGKILLTGKKLTKPQSEQQRREPFSQDRQTCKRRRVCRTD